MTPIVSTIEIARPPDEVFSYVTDPSRFSEWQKGVVTGGMLDDAAPAAGSRCTTTRRIGGGERTTTQVITEISPPRSWSVRGLDGPIRANVKVLVEPLDDGGRSRLTITLDLEGHGVGRMIAPAVRRGAAKEAPNSCRNLKERLERGQ